MSSRARSKLSVDASMDDRSPPTQHIVIVEPNGDGHRLSYVADLARCALRSSYRVTLVVPDGAPEAEIHLAGLDETCEIVAHPGRQSLSKLSRRLGSDVLVVPDGDRVAVSIGLRLSIRRAWMGRGSIRILLMRWGHDLREPSLMSRARQFAKRVAIRRASRLDGVALVALASASGADTGEGLLLAPDPVRVSADTLEIARLRAEWDSTDGRPVVAVVGALDRRKNIPTVLDALDIADRRDIVLVIAGRIETGVLEEITPKIAALRTLGQVIVVTNRNLSDIELDATVAAADYVVLAHSNEGPSGILGKAMALGTGIIAAGAESLQRDVAKLGRDLDSWCSLSPEDLALALERVRVHDHSVRVSTPGADEFASAVLGLPRA